MLFKHRFLRRTLTFNLVESLKSLYFTGYQTLSGVLGMNISLIPLLLLSAAGLFSEAKMEW